MRERARLECWRGEVADPVRRLTDFLTAAGMPVGLTGTATGGPECDGAGPGTVCGAAVLLSAAACAEIAGAEPGPPSPAPAVPDLVAVVYEHAADLAGGGEVLRPDPPYRSEPAGDWRLGRWRRSWTRARHAAVIERVREAISRGEVYQVNVVGHWSAPYRGMPDDAVRAVTGLPGARYAGALGGGGWTVACASPEALVTVTDGAIETRPVKGTRPATATGRAELLGSAKERAEHVMIVDLERNDLSRVAEVGSVHVPSLFELRRWCGLWQAESVVRARLAAGTSLAEVLRAVCPGGSVTGAPKLAAIERIGALEPVGRGPSMGAFGYLTPGRLDLGLTIRTVAFDDTSVHVWAGGGITWSSDPVAEVTEAEAKARPLLAALAGSARRGIGPPGRNATPAQQPAPAMR